MPKVVLDRRAKADYRVVLASYGEILNRRLNACKLDEDRFWFLQHKLSEWFDNYNPVVPTQPHPSSYKYYRENQTIET